mgnify:FL=1
MGIGDLSGRPSFQWRAFKAGMGRAWAASQEEEME